MTELATAYVDDETCPFCRVALGRIAFVDTLVTGVWDAFPVSEGHLLIVPNRHVAGWDDLTDAERAAVLHAVSRGRALVHERFTPDGFNVGFNDGPAAGQTVPHFHVHVIPRRHGDMSDPRGGVRHVIPDKGNYLASKPATAPTRSNGTPHDRALIAGGEDTLIQHLLPHIDEASAIDVAVSFILDSGVRLLRPHLQDLLDRNGRLRLVAGDYLDVTDPSALRRLLDLEGDAHLFVFEAEKLSFHPKSWLFHHADGGGVAIVGSSNLSETALRKGVEWNYRVWTSSAMDGWRDVLAGFENLLNAPQVRPLDHAWVDKYQARREKAAPAAPRLIEVAPEPAPEKPRPHEVQRRALEALRETRAEGYTAGLVVLATGLGKTWLSAFDSDNPEFRRVLFVAHREEILTQAMETFRRCRPQARFGRYTGEVKDLDADVLFASVQTLGRAAHLRRFAPDAFDYVVVDEFHHAAAQTYRGLIEHFTPKFLLGLTATPERMDGGDLLGLCQENLVFRCDAFEAIDRGLLSSFRYFGVPDEVDYANIPWRSSRFDEAALTEALATERRAQNALEQHRRHGGARTIGFCCSRLHANFMARYFNDQGLRAVAVHSGPESAPRATSLEKLEAGELDVIFAVDMFNEGVDVPSIDTVLMLRPTESAVIWMQQFGRGLRRAEGKSRLNVVDYIGNHRIFLTKARALLRAGDGDRALALAIEKVRLNQFELPPGCEVTYELEALETLEGLIKSTARGDALEALYADFQMRHGTRPTAREIYHAGFNPRTTGHGSWFGFVDHMGDLTEQERTVHRRFGGFLDSVSRTPMSRSYKMLLLQAMQAEGAIPGEVGINRLAERFVQFARRNPRFRNDLSVDLDDLTAVRRLLIKHPIAAWVDARGTGGTRYFQYEGGVLSTAFGERDHNLKLAFQALLEELVEWRLAEYLDRGTTDAEEAESGERLNVAEPATTFAPPAGAELWREYMREEIPPLYGLAFSTGSWNQGFVVQGRHVFLLVTLDKDDLLADHRYDDRFLDPARFYWQSQNRTERGSKHGRIISGAVPGYTIHLFVRQTKRRGTAAAPFIYCGDVQFESWEGDKPISVVWRLTKDLPSHLHRSLAPTGFRGV